MFVNTLPRRIIFNAFLLLFLFCIHYHFFAEIYSSTEIVISFAVHPFNICKKYPDIWLTIKLLYIPIVIISSLILINLLYSSLFSKKKIKLNKNKNTAVSSDLYISIPNNQDLANPIILPEAGLYQNCLITGTIGSGKTSSIMYPFTRQLIKYKYNDSKNKLGMLILDVKGNYYSQVKKYADYYRRSDDLIIIELGRQNKI